MQELASLDTWSDILSFEIRLKKAPNEHDFQVTIEKATGLTNADSTFFMRASKADPYCICYADSNGQSRERTQFKTKVINNSSEPVWNETGNFSCTSDELQLV